MKFTLHRKLVRIFSLSQPMYRMMGMMLYCQFKLLLLKRSGCVLLIFLAWESPYLNLVKYTTHIECEEGLFLGQETKVMDLILDDVSSFFFHYIPSDLNALFHTLIFLKCS